MYIYYAKSNVFQIAVIAVKRMVIRTDEVQTFCHFMMEFLVRLITETIRERSKFTGYLGRVFRKICLKRFV